MAWPAAVSARCRRATAVPAAPFFSTGRLGMVVRSRLIGVVVGGEGGGVLVARLVVVLVEEARLRFEVRVLLDRSFLALGHGPIPSVVMFLMIWYRLRRRPGFQPSAVPA